MLNLNVSSSVIWPLVLVQGPGSNIFSFSSFLMVDSTALLLLTHWVCLIPPCCTTGPGLILAALNPVLWRMMLDNHLSLIEIILNVTLLLFFSGQRHSQGSKSGIDKAKALQQL